MWKKFIQNLEFSSIFPFLSKPITKQEFNYHNKLGANVSPIVSHLTIIPLNLNHMHIIMEKNIDYFPIT
jgi:hypothetical protein